MLSWKPNPGPCVCKAGTLPTGLHLPPTTFSLCMETLRGQGRKAELESSLGYIPKNNWKHTRHVCICIHVSMFTWVQAQVNTKCEGRSEVNTGCLPQPCSTLLRTLTWPCHTQAVRLATSASLVPWFLVAAIPAQLFCRFSNCMKTCKYFIYRIVSLSPQTD